MTNRLSRVKLSIIVAIFVSGSLLLGPQQAQASVITTGCSNVDVSCTLAELFNLALPGSITVNGVMFSGFSPTSSPTFSTSAVVVTGMSASLNPGLRYEGNSQFVTPGFSEVEFLFEFKFDASVVAGLDIKDTSLQGSGFYKGETPINPGNPFVGTVTISTDLANLALSKTWPSTDLGLPQQSSFTLGPASSIDISPTVNSITVTTSVLLQPGADPAPIELQEFTQRFSQVGFVAPAPEPATLFLLSGGLAALGWMRRRRNG